MEAFPFTGALLTSMLAAGSALAADLVKAPVAAAVVFDWTRPYLGLNLGYSLGGQTADGTVTGASTTAGVVTRLVPVPLLGAPTSTAWMRVRSSEIIGWLVGLEGDVQGTNEHKSSDVYLLDVRRDLRRIPWIID